MAKKQVSAGVFGISDWVPFFEVSSINCPFSLLPTAIFTTSSHFSRPTIDQVFYALDITPQARILLSV